MGISRTGDATESEFFRLTGATRTERAADGDAVLDGVTVEVKHVSGGTLNQVRAVKYLVLVAFDARTSTWYVVPPHEVVRLVSTRSRGQHTENPFESSTLTVSRLADFALEDPSTLGPAVLAAARSGAEHPEVRAMVLRVLAASRLLAEESRSWAAAALAAPAVPSAH